MLTSERLVNTVRGRSGGSYVARVVPESLSAYLLDAVEMLPSSQAVRLQDLIEGQPLIEPIAAHQAAARHLPKPLAILRSQVALASDPTRDYSNWKWPCTPCDDEGTLSRCQPPAENGHTGSIERGMHGQVRSGRCRDHRLQQV